MNATRIASGTSGSILLSRIGATAIDIVVMFSILMSAEVVLGRDVYRQTALLWVLVAIAYFVGMEAKTGATLGKRAVGLRVVDQNGQPPGVRRALIRFALWPFEICALGALVILLSQNKQRIGDSITDTFVLRTKDVAAGRSRG